MAKSSEARGYRKYIPSMTRVVQIAGRPDRSEVHHPHVTADQASRRNVWTNVPDP